jgi:hypothetical protein
MWLWLLILTSSPIGKNASNRVNDGTFVSIVYLPYTQVPRRSLASHPSVCSVNHKRRAIGMAWHGMAQ